MGHGSRGQKVQNWGFVSGDYPLRYVIPRYKAEGQASMWQNGDQSWILLLGACPCDNIINLFMRALNSPNYLSRVPYPNAITMAAKFQPMIWRGHSNHSTRLAVIILLVIRSWWALQIGAKFFHYTLDNSQLQVYTSFKKHRAHLFPNGTENKGRKQNYGHKFMDCKSNW